MNADFSKEQILEALIEIVADKTGYPAEMLDSTLDLEADLSVDSIKRIEILNSLNARLPIASDVEENAEATMEELARIKTLEGIAGWLYNKMAADAHSTVETISSADSHGMGPNNEEMFFELNRYKPVLAPAPEPMINGIAVNGKFFTLTKDNIGISERLAAKLTQLGAQVQILENSYESDMLGKTDALIHLGSLSGKDNTSAIDFFKLIKRIA